MLGLAFLTGVATTIAVGWDIWVFRRNRLYPGQTTHETISTVIGRHPVIGGCAMAAGAYHFWSHKAVRRG